MKIEVETPFDIGQQFWFIRNSKMEKGWIAEVQLIITSNVEGDGYMGWHFNFMQRFYKSKHKDVYKANKPVFTAKIFLDRTWMHETIKEKNGKYFINRETPIYFSEQELIDDLKR